MPLGLRGSTSVDCLLGPANTSVALSVTRLNCANPPHKLRKSLSQIAQTNPLNCANQRAIQNRASTDKARQHKGLSHQCGPSLTQNETETNSNMERKTKYKTEPNGWARILTERKAVGQRNRLTLSSSRYSLSEYPNCGLIIGLKPKRWPTKRRSFWMAKQAPALKGWGPFWGPKLNSLANLAILINVLRCYFDSGTDHLKSMKNP